MRCDGQLKKVGKYVGYSLLEPGGCGHRVATAKREEAGLDLAHA
jgi:hypothetical protein